MPKVLNGITVDSPTGPLSLNTSDTFSFAGTPSFSGSGGVQRYDWKWEVDSGGGYVTIASSGTGLITADTNPLINSNSQTSNSITVTCDAVGTYTIRMVGAPTTGGSYTVISATESVTVSAPLNHYTLTADAGSYTLTGQTATILKTRLLTANNGSYALTGQDATITYTPITGYTLTADAGSYTIAGQAATITYYQNFTVTADAGSYSITGQAATLLKTNILSASNGSYTLTGQAATFDYGVPPRMAWLLMEDGFALLQEDGGHLLLEPLEFIVIAQNGAYTITGQAAALSRSYNITAENGSYTITGQAAEIDRGYLLTADAGSYTLTGQSANILKTRILTADAGSYALTGQASDIILGRLISAEFGIYNVDGQPATINFESRTVGDVWIHLRSFTERRRF